MLRHTIWIIVLGLIVGGCASDSGKMEGSGGSSSPAKSENAASSPTAAVPSQSMSGGAAVSSPTMSAEARSSNSMNESTATKNRIAAGVEEETLDTCLAQIPQDGTVGQKLLAEQTCRRNFSTRR
ncbi:MAG TPA: hypothetical protein VL261_01780 [Nitrospira sp.]|jgi:hypothetical protein|nr:hypothetical protein [Nitrospira sp.]